MAKIDDIANNYLSEWIKCFNEGTFEKLMDLYDEEAYFVWFESAKGKDNIVNLIKGVFDRGWSFNKAEVLFIKKIDSKIFFACSYEGQRKEDSDVVIGNSSHVLEEVDGRWIAHMHSTT